MKFLNVIGGVLLTIGLAGVAGVAEEPPSNKEVYEIDRYIMGSYGDSDNSRRVFVSGVSNNQIAQDEAEAERERERISLANQVSQASYEGSYTGQGYDIKIVGKDTFWNCVLFSKDKTGITRTIGYGGIDGINSWEPQVGAIASEEIYTQKGLVRHASVVIAVYDDSIRVIESNYRRGYLTERTIPKSQIIGYIV